MLVPTISLFCISILYTPPFSDTIKLKSKVTFTLDSLEIQPLPEVIGYKFGNVSLVIRVDTASIDRESGQMHLSGRVLDEELNIGISSCTIAIGSLTTERGIMKFTPHLQVLTDEEGRFSLIIPIVRNDVLLLSWTGEVYRIYRIGTLIR